MNDIMWNILWKVHRYKSNKLSRKTKLQTRDSTIFMKRGDSFFKC